MKIAHLSNQTSWGGGEKQLVYLVEALKTDKSVAQSVFCRQNSKLHSCLKKIQEIEIVELSSSRLRSSWILRRHLERFDLVHAHDSSSHSLVLIAQYLLAAPQRPLLIHRRVIHCSPPWWGAKKKYCMPNLAAIFCVSSSVLDSMRIVVGSQTPLRLVPSAIRPTKIADSATIKEHRKSWRLSSQHLVIASIGALTAQKCQLDFVAIAAQLLATAPHKLRNKLRFLIFGEGPMRTKIAASIRSFGIDKFCKLMGFYPELGSGIAAIDCLVSTARNEALGNIFLEAFAANVPVVAYASGGIGDLVVDNRTGFLIPSRNPSLYAQRILQLLTEPETRKSLCHTAYAHLANFQVDTMAKTVKDTYRAVLEQGS